MNLIQHLEDQIVEEILNYEQLSLITSVNNILHANGIHVTSSQQTLDEISKKIKAAIKGTNPIISDEISTIQIQVDQSTTSQTKEQDDQRRCSYFPLHWRFQNADHQFFIFGGLCIDFNYKNGIQNATKRLMKRIERTEYLKQKGLMILHYDDQSPTIKNLSFLIDRAQSMGDYQFYILSLCLAEYQKQIPKFIQIGQIKQDLYKELNLLDQYDEEYAIFEKWAIEETKKLDTSQMFGFSIHKFNLRTLEFETKKVGYSSAFMALRGIDLDNPFQYVRKETYHYLDGESNINLLINQMTQVVNGREIFPFKAYIKTFDDLTIEAETYCKQFTNRDDAYPFKSHFQASNDFKYEFMIGIGYYDISVQNLKRLIQIRKKRDATSNQQFDDFSYSIQSQLFLEQYYNEKLQGNQSTHCETHSQPSQKEKDSI